MKPLFRIYACAILCLQLGATKAQEINPMLVGVNVWYIDPSQQVWDLTQECGVGSIRIGGHSYDDNMPSKSQLKDWVSLIQAMGAEPILQMSQYDGAAAAADLVKYFNIDLATGTPIKYWNIGNEPWLQNGKPAISTVGAMVEAYFKPIAVAMKEVDPTIKIYGPDFCYYIGEAINDLFGGKNDIAGKIPGKDYYYCDGISWHRYPQDDNINLAYAGVDDFKSSIIACKAKVDAVNAAYNRTGDDALGWGIGEYNAKGGAVVHTWMNGHMYGGVLDLCMKYGANYATSWSMFENGGNRQGTDFSFIDGAHMTPRANYRHMQMVAKYFKGTYKAGTSSLSDIIVSGSVDGDTISVMIMNRASAPAAYSLYLNKTDASESGVNLNVDADTNLMHIDMISGEATHLLLFKDGKILKQNYSSVHFDNELPPDESYVIPAMYLPSAPVGLACSNPSYKSVDLSWNVNENDTITGFIIERKLTSGGSYMMIGIAANNTLSYNDNTVDPLTDYTYRVQSYNSAGFSEYSNESTVTTAAVPPKVAFNGPHAIPGRIEAEDYNDNEEGIGYHDAEPDNQGGTYRTDEGVDIESCTDEGGGYNVGYIEAGEWMEYSIATVDGGTFDIAVRIASNATVSSRIKVYLADKYLGYVTPVFTGGWQNWKTLIINDKSISGGNDQILKLVFEGSDYNLNWIEFGTELAVKKTDHFDSIFFGYYDSMNGSLIIKSEFPVHNVNISLYDTLGKKQFQFRENDFVSNVYPIDLASGFYFLSVASERGSLTSKILVP